jgi:hypothetical protein
MVASDSQKLISSECFDEDNFIGGNLFKYSLKDNSNSSGPKSY